VREGLLLIDAAELELDEEGTRISLTIVDTPGFGDQVDNEARFVTSERLRTLFQAQALTSCLCSLASPRSSATLNVNTMTF